MSHTSLDTIVDDVHHKGVHKSVETGVASPSDPLDTIEPAGPDRVLHAESFSTSDPACPVKLRLGSGGKDDADARQPLSLPTAVKRACDAAYELPAMRVEREGVWLTWTYGRYYHDIKAAAKAFIKFGLEPCHSVCIQSFNCPEWFIADIAAIFAGGLACGLYTTNSDETTKFIMEDSRCDIAVAENADVVQRILAMKPDLPGLKKIVQIHGEVEVSHPDVISWSELIALGDEIPDNLQLLERLQDMAINKCCTLVYTSGTTGNPKGVMLSHDNLSWTVLSILNLYDVQPNSEVWVSYLPLNHIAAMCMDLWAPLFAQGLVYFADRSALKGSLVDTLRIARPTRFLAVPRVWEKMMETMVSRASDTNPRSMRAKIIRASRRAGENFHLNGRDSFVYRWADSFVYRKVKDALGLDACQTLISGAAPISDEVVRFFAGFDINILNIYGLSETTAVVLVNLPYLHGLGGAGIPPPGVKFKIKPPDQTTTLIGNGNSNGHANGNGYMNGHSKPHLLSAGHTRLNGNVPKDRDSKSVGDVGELLVSSRGIMMGYLNREDKTREALDEAGWFRTGDTAKVEEEGTGGFVRVVGRAKEILVTSGGENIAPVPIEDKIKAALPVIANAVVVGDGRKHLSAFLTLKSTDDPEKPEQDRGILTDAAIKWCKEIGSNAKTVDDIIGGEGDERVFFAIQDAIDDVNASSPSRPSKVQKWTILPRDLSIRGGELGPTLKLRRFYFYEKYRKPIDRMYHEKSVMTNGNGIVI